MTKIKCPYDLNQFILGPSFENTFSKEECEQKKFYGDCYHCFATAIAKRDHQLKNATPRETVTEFADRCRECGREKVLDKIRTEIDMLSNSRCDGTTVTIYSWNGMKRKVLDIIDKYEAESER